MPGSGDYCGQARKSIAPLIASKKKRG